jgi:hypothetical protein
MRALQRLSHLRGLRLYHCRSAPDLAAADVLQVLCGFRHMHALHFHLHWAPPPQTLGKLGAALLRLRDLRMQRAVYLAPALDPVEQQATLQGQLPMPLFRGLEALAVLRFGVPAAEFSDRR